MLRWRCSGSATTPVSGISFRTFCGSFRYSISDIFLFGMPGAVATLSE